MNRPERVEVVALSAFADPPAISIRGVRKAYSLYDRPLSFLAEIITGRRHHREKEVLRDISLEIPRGEVVGIIGRNGAGKSTLLKMIAGTLSPTEGKIEVRGRVSAILELGTGFNQAYSGRDNVIMSGLIRGMSEAEIRSKFDGIVAFAGLQDVIDQPFQTYSSGMQARLAFAAAVAAEADVIIIDEALAAGDIQFTARSLVRIREICKSGVTALFVSHQTYHVMQLCTRAIWLDEGRIRMDGSPLEVCRAYEYEMHKAVARDEGRLIEPPGAFVDSSSTAPTDGLVPSGGGAAVGGPAALPQAPVASAQPTCGPQPPAPATVNESNSCPPDTEHFSTHEYEITHVQFLDDAGHETMTFRFGEPFRLRVAYRALGDEPPEVSCGLAVAFTSVPEYQAVMYFNSNYPHSDREMLEYDHAEFRRYKGRTGVIEARIPFMQLKAGEYLVSLGILPNRQEFHEFYEYRHLTYRVTVLPNGYPEPSVFYAQVHWTNGPA